MVSNDDSEVSAIRGGGLIKKKNACTLFLQPFHCSQSTIVQLMMIDGIIHTAIVDPIVARRERGWFVACHFAQVL